MSSTIKHPLSILIWIWVFALIAAFALSGYLEMAFMTACGYALGLLAEKMRQAEKAAQRGESEAAK